MTWSFLWSLVQPRLLAGLKWVAVAAAALSVLLAARRAGRNAERVENLQETLDAADKARRIEVDVRSRDGSDAAVRERMRKQRRRLGGD